MKKNKVSNISVDWLEPLIKSTGGSLQSLPEEIFQQTDNVANKFAPNMRALWKFIFLIEGVAVLIPTIWLIVARVQWNPLVTSIVISICLISVISILWWLRWKKMQHAWSRCRLVAEIMRSKKAVHFLSRDITVDALISSPTVQKVAKLLPRYNSIEKDADIVSLKKTYRKERIEDQINYFKSKKISSEKQRHRISQYITWSLDGALFLAIASIVLTVEESNTIFIRLSGVDYVLGFVGILLPLSAIILQAMSSYLELNRNTGLYTKQIDFLLESKERLDDAMDLSEIQLIIKEVETELLAEVVKWFYESENTEIFYRSKIQNTTDFWENQKIKKSVAGGLFQSILNSGAFFLNVLFGRILIVAISMVFTIVLISYYAPQDKEHKSRLIREDGRLLSSSKASNWEPRIEKTSNGLILIAHGLHDGVKFKSTGAHWMTKMQEALEEKLAEKLPDICLVDWHKAAVPAIYSNIGLEYDNFQYKLPQSAAGWLQDIIAIRPTAQEIGKLVGFKIAMEIYENKIPRDVPIHLIGHSAGGFVVLNAAKVLQRLKLAGKNMHITMLDTPVPDIQEMEEVLKHSTVDFYKTSLFTEGTVPELGFHQNYTLFEISVPTNLDSFVQAHSYVTDWYTGTISNENPRGFSRSNVYKQIAN